MESFTPVLRFIASSDLHANREVPQRVENYRKGLSLAYNYAENSSYKNIDLVCINGDFADGGADEQMQDVRDIFDECLKPETKWMLTMASHEFFCEGGEKAAIEKFGRIFNIPTDNHFVINGFHFITVTTTNGCRFSDEKRNWIRCELDKAVADNPFKPVFFFQHPHIQGTVYGNVYWGEDEITDILMNYPQIIDFSGHSHAPVNDPRSIHQQHFTSVGTGSFKYFELDEFDKIYGTVPPDKVEAAQFVIVEADANGRVLIKPYDVLTESFFGYEWLVETPWEPDTFTYTDERWLNPVKPYFTEDSKVDITVENGCVNVEFTQAKIDEDRVNDYKVTVRRKSDNAIVRQLCFWSRYYFNDMPQTIDCKIENLVPGEYTMTISARGFWNNKSTNTLTADFTV